MRSRLPDYDIHPLAELFPFMNEHDASALAQSIRDIGLQQPIVLYEGKILDGRNRYVACSNLRIIPEFTQYQGDDPLGFVISANIALRHLTEAQRSMVAAKIANMRRGRPSNTDRIQTVSISQEQAADLLHVGRSSVIDARTIIQRGTPELATMVERGEVAVSAAAEVARLPRAQQRSIVREGAASIASAAREQRQERQSRPRADGVTPLVRKVLALLEHATPAEKKLIKKALNQ
jgi:ParB family chromosome partitioning protein